MTKDGRNRSRRNGGNNANANGRSNGRNQSNRSTPQTKAILKIKRAKRNEHQVKATFEDSAGNEVKEMIYTFSDGDPKELLIDCEKQLLKLGDRYELFNDGKWKALCQLGGRCFEGRIEEHWSDLVGGIRNHATGDSAAQRAKFKKQIQKVNAKYLTERAVDHQKDAMENGELKYEGHDHLRVVERLFQINEDLDLFSENAEKYSMREMARKIIPKNLKANARLKYLDKGIDDLRDRDDILKECARITDVLDAEAEIEREKKSKQSNGNGNRNGNGNQNNERSTAGEQDGKKQSQPCRKHDGKHLWKDCPDNWHNKTKSGDADKKGQANRSTKRGEVKSTESGNNKTPLVRFEESDVEPDDESENESQVSRGELMEIATDNVLSQSLHPITIITMLDKSKQRVASKALVDQCCTDTGLISWELAKMLQLPTIDGNPRTFITAAGTFTADKILRITDAMLPCLSTNRTFSIDLMVIPEKCSADMNYGAIIGQESMRLLDLDTSIRENTISWGEKSIPMVPRDYWTAERIQQQKARLNKQPTADLEPELEVDDEIFLAEALAPVNYVKANLPEIAWNCKDLTSEEQAQLLVVLEKHAALFQGRRGEWKGNPVNIEVIEGSTPVWAKPYPVPLKNREVFKDEVYRQCDIGALRELSAEEIEKREWASPCFGVPKKNGSIRLVMDFRQINKVLKRKEYPLPTIDELFQDVKGFEFASVVDLNMGYLSIPLTDESKALLTIVTMFGFFECCVLPMGVKPATDIFQSRMVGVFQPMRENRPKPYIDDIFHGKGKTFIEHLNILDEIFRRLEDAGMQVNLDKSELCAHEVEFLGFLLKQGGFTPTRKRIEAILKLARPHNVKKVRGFLGTINFIKNHIPNRAEIMAPITNLTKDNVPFIWGEEEESAFEKTKAAVANAILCTYPDPNKQFIIYSDASQKYAMGGLLCQVHDGVEQVVSTFSRKFNDAQLKYPVGEQELLAAHESCRFFHNIIHGCDILIRCDHKNLTRADTKHLNLRVLRQRLTLDQEYGAKLEHYAGELNTGADGLSRLEMSDEVPQSTLIEVYAINELDPDTNVDFPLAMTIIKAEQDKDEKIQSMLTQEKYNRHFATLTFGQTTVHTLDGKILVPTSLQSRVIDWYHTNLRHPGVTRTANSIAQIFGWRGMRTQVEEHVKSCDECQRHKIVGKPSYGKLPLVPALRDKKPFEKVHVDCAGPWTVRVKDDLDSVESPYQIHILSMVDACSSWCELALIPTANSKSVAAQFDANWLCRYPRPSEVGHDNGNEFMGEEFQELLISYDIKSKPTTVKNPTAQSVVERLHLTLGDQLRTSLYSGDRWQEDVNVLIQACAWANRTTVPSSMPYNPSQLTFGMDMIFRQKIKIDWQLLKEQRRRQAIANNAKENKTRIQHEYKVGDLVLIVEKSYERAKKAKLSSPTEGPYEILRVYTNGNVRIRRGNYDEDISIRRLRPYYNRE